MSGRQLHLNVNILHAGFSPAAWRMDGVDPYAAFTVDHYVQVAKIAERAKLDAIFFADQAAISDRIDYRPITSLEPTIVLATIAAATERIGLIATASTSFNEPYNIARRFATLDHVSGGRIGWNIVTTADPASARNFGLTGAIDHGGRYERAAEFTEIVKALWDSWEDDAFIGDVASGRFVDAAKVHAIEHEGRIFRCMGRTMCRARRKGIRWSSRPAVPMTARSSPRATPKRCFPRRNRSRRRSPTQRS